MPVCDNGRKTREIKYDINDKGCFVCTSHINSRLGYPEITVNKNRWRMNRYIYTINKGEIPKGLIVRHTCDNPKCINPDHLIIGTYSDNNWDRTLRNRNNDINGEKNGQAKLTEKQVIEILNSKLSTSKLGKLYGVTRITIGSIKRKKLWKYLHYDDKPEDHNDRVNREDRQEEILEGARESFILNWREGK